MINKKKYKLPHLKGDEWLKSQIPGELQNWLDSRHSIRQRTTGLQKSRAAVRKLLSEHHWEWPQRPVVFISDLHADADAMLASLVASGGIRRTGTADHQFKITKEGRQACTLLGGDFFDKGPSNLRLLRVIKQLQNKELRVQFLAGNHDVRTLIGMRSIGNTDDPENGHFFIRMGAKAVPFLAEIRDAYITTRTALKGVPGKKKCRKLLYPSDRWWKEFPRLAGQVMSRPRLETEMVKIQRKTVRFEEICEEAGLSLREVFAAGLKWQDLFLSKNGEFHWFFRGMKLAYQQGSFLFVHAGIDDQIAMLLAENGTKFLNRTFKKQLKGSPFDFYYGPVANTMRTKYRSIDLPLSGRGTKYIHQTGIRAIVHGHRNLHCGQRIALRKNLLHFECDITLDQGTRQKENLTGPGAGATLIYPEGYILGISTDFGRIKVFDPEVILS